MIVLTGDMSRDRSGWENELGDRGLVPRPSVTMNVELVVTADPGSLSGKAEKARDSGMPLVREDALRRMPVTTVP